jgi:hypothetical protein
MSNMFSSIIGLFLSFINAVIPAQKTLTRTYSVINPTIMVSPIIMATPTQIATSPATPIQIATDMPKSTQFVTATPLPKPTLDLAKNEECNKLNLPIYLFSGTACLPKENITPEVSSVCRFEDTNTRCFDKHENWEPGVIKLDQDNVRNRILMECQKVDKGDFQKCNASIETNGGRLQEELGKDIDSEFNSCVNSLEPGKDSLKTLTITYIKRNRLKAKLEYIYDFCFSHGYSVDQLHF